MTTMSAISKFPMIQSSDWAKSFDDYRSNLWPDELSCERIIREGDLVHTPAMALKDGILWRPVDRSSIGRRVGISRIRRPVKFQPQPSTTNHEQTQS